MAEFRNALKEIHEVQNRVILFNTFLSSLLVFLLCFFVLRLFNFYYWGISVAVFMIYFAISLQFGISSKNLMDIEKKNPFLAEKLRTAADHSNIVNYVVLKLHENVMNALKDVKISSFIDVRRLTYVVFAIIMALGLVMFSASNDLLIYDLEAGIKSISFNGNKDILDGIVPNSLIEADVSIEELNENAEIKDIVLVTDKHHEKRDLYLPEDIFELSDKSFEEELPKKKRIYIRKYFGEIRKYGFER